MKTKMVALFATLMVTLMVAGVTYACWQETLIINGVVNTGDLDVEWSWAYTNDPEGSNDPGLMNVVTTTETVGGYSDTYAASGDYGFYDKDVANATVEIKQEYQEPNDKLIITIKNAYPSYAPHIWFAVDNIGDIPVNMSDFTIAYDGLTGDAAAKKLDQDGIELIAWEVTYNGEHLYGSSKGSYTGLPFIVDEKDEGIYCMHHLIEYLKTVQIDPGDYLDVHLIFHFEQWLEQDATITFEITGTFVQWNCNE